MGRGQWLAVVLQDCFPLRSPPSRLLCAPGCQRSHVSPHPSTHPNAGPGHQHPRPRVLRGRGRAGRVCNEHLCVELINSSYICSQALRECFIPNTWFSFHKLHKSTGYP